LNNDSNLNIDAYSDNFNSNISFKYDQSNPIKELVLNSAPQGGIETPTPTTTTNPTEISNTIPTPKKQISDTSPSPEDDLNIATNEGKEINSRDQKKNENSDKKLSGIIFGLGALLIVG